MPVLAKKTRVLFSAFLVIFFVALAVAEVSLVTDLFLAPASMHRAYWVAAIALTVMMFSGMAIMAMAYQGRGQEHFWEEAARGLAETGNLPDTAAKLARLAHGIAPRARVAVYALDLHTLQYEVQATCDREGRLAMPPDVSWLGSENTGMRMMELKLMIQNRQVGALILEYPIYAPLEAEQVRLLNLVLPWAALAFENFLLRRLSDEQSAAMEAQRRRIAQDLHDSLAQNIGYLRLKLDQLTCQPLDQPGVDLNHELERMQATAEEAYHQIRNTLDELNPVVKEDLQETLQDQAQPVCRRAGLHLRIHQIGAPFVLPPAVRHHILYVAREALFNIEKHAMANLVLVQLLWLENEFILKITDDGTGFDPQQARSEGHYGLWIMNYRAREAGGNLKITPGEEGRGTEVTLWVPRTKAGEPHDAFSREKTAPAAHAPVNVTTPARLSPDSLPAEKLTARNIAV